MSTSLILGVAGAALSVVLTGGTAFLAAGFLIGSLIGTLVDPPKVEGPKLNDLKLQVSTYGKMIPYVWGTGRMSGNIIDQTDLQEHKQKSGGKGGPEVTSYTYSASFDILLCVGPILGIKRIWADARLIWSDTTGEDIPCTVYLGAADQDPDPTFEAIHGVGNVPGYNGFAHVVFSDYFLTDFGNRIPQLEFEVYTKVGIFPWRVSTFNIAHPDGFSLRSPAAIYEEGNITVGWGWRGSFPPAHYFAQWKVDGTLVTPHYVTSASEVGFVSAHNKLDWSDGTLIDIATGLPYPAYTIVEMVSMADAPALQVRFITNSDSGQYELWVSVSTGGAVSVGPYAGTSPSLFNIGTSNVVDETDGGYAAGGVSVYKVYLTDQNDLASSHFWLYEFDYTVTPVTQTITLSRTFDLFAEYNAVPIGGNFIVYRNSHDELILAIDRGIAGSKQVYAFYMNDDLSVTPVGGVDYGSIFGPAGIVSLLGRGPYLLTDDGVISLEPPTAPEKLSKIVGDISTLTPLGSGSPTQYDVSELTDDVRWFAIASQMTARNALQVLRPAFFFDGVESNDTVIFKKRGGAPVFRIPDDSLCGRSYGEESGDPLRTIRTKEQGLPRTVTMTYYDVDTDYQVGAQSSPRIVTLSEQDVTLDIPVGFTATEALQKCWAIQSAEWIRRERFEWKCTRNAPVRNLLTDSNVPACLLEPCDVGFVRGREIQIETINTAPNGVMTFTGVLSAPSIYTQSAPSVAGGFVSQGAPGTSVQTELVLLDIPILSQDDAPFGFYAAMGPASAGRWPGATLFKSVDNGTTYNAVAAAAIPAIIGLTTTSAVGSPTVDGVIATYGGGDVVDESELCITLTDENAELESINAIGLTNGLNLCAISTGLQGSPGLLKWELLQFRDATLIAPKTYILKGFLRGRKGTATSGHAEGDKFVLLSTVVNVDAPESELNLSLKYKAVTFGNALAEAAVQDFINTGLSADEFFGTEVEHLPPFGGDVGSPGTGGAPGMVPAPPPGACGLGMYLDACGGWSVPTGPVPTGTGFRHVTAGVEDAAARAVDLSTADATGILAAARFPALTGDVTTVAGAVATTIPNNTVTNAKLADVNTATFKGRTTAGSGDPEDLTATQATALLNVMGADSGAGGIKGLAGAPAAGDAAAGKFWRADATWAVPGGVSLSNTNIWTKNQSVTFVALTDGATINTDASLSNNFSVTLGGNRTLANPTNLTDGMILNFYIEQDGTGTRTLAYGAKFKFPGGVNTLSTAASARDFISCCYHAGDDILICNLTKTYS